MLVETGLVETALIETALVETALVETTLLETLKLVTLHFLNFKIPFRVFLQLIMPQSFCFNLLRSAEEVTLYLFVFFKLLVFVMEN